MIARPPHVAILAYDQLCLFEFGIAVEIFMLERPELRDIGWYTAEIVAIEPGPLRSTGGLAVEAPAGLERLAYADLIIVPGWRGKDAPVPGDLKDALVAASCRGARIATLCSGVFVPARCGLLDGRRATTHWRYAAALAEHFPAIRVEADVLYLDEGSILTAAGSAAGIDLCLHIVRRDFGAEVANKVAQRLVLPAHREGGQAQFVTRPVTGQRQSRIGPLCDRLLERMDEPWTIAGMARLANLSERSLIRHFQAATGLSPLSWLIAERVERCRELLESSRLGLAEICAACGFGAPETMRLHFRRRIGVSPAAYRRSFGRMAT
jgi:AraC family transcriptional activator FtrA